MPNLSLQFLMHLFGLNFVMMTDVVDIHSAAVATACLTEFHAALSLVTIDAVTETTAEMIAQTVARIAPA